MRGSDLTKVGMGEMATRGPPSLRGFPNILQYTLPLHPNNYPTFPTAGKRGLGKKKEGDTQKSKKAVITSIKDDQH